MLSIIFTRNLLKNLTEIVIFYGQKIMYRNQIINLKILLSDHLAKKRFKNKSVRNNCKDLDVSIKRDVCY